MPFIQNQVFQSLSLCGSRNGGSHKSSNIGLELNRHFSRPCPEAGSSLFLGSMEPEPSGSAEYNSYRISEDSTNNLNPLTTTPAMAQSQLTNFLPWSTASFNFPSSVSSPSPTAEGQHVLQRARFQVSLPPSVSDPLMTELDDHRPVLNVYPFLVFLKIFLLNLGFPGAIANGNPPIVPSQ
ncbi:hypothetical protein EDD16DRAFT_1714435 [Pisolithus croceorrhizus]|nr:hypothetical protein EDD16DRAFT_1714435 [Pisolithus croceorrhizus]